MGDGAAIRDGVAMRDGVAIRDGVGYFGELGWERLGKLDSESWESVGKLGKRRGVAQPGSAHRSGR